MDKERIFSLVFSNPTCTFTVQKAIGETRILQSQTYICIYTYKETDLKKNSSKVFTAINEKFSFNVYRDKLGFDKPRWYKRKILMLILANIDIKLGFQESQKFFL